MCVYITGACYYCRRPVRRPYNIIIYKRMLYYCYAYYVRVYVLWYIYADRTHQNVPAYARVAVASLYWRAACVIIISIVIKIISFSAPRSRHRTHTHTTIILLCIIWLTVVVLYGSSRSDAFRNNISSLFLCYVRNMCVCDKCARRRI